jgi:phosphoglycolate phosphatase-like HAD superfamily hydrolase
VRTLVLWDIDHTLIDGGGLSREIYGAVFAQVVGRPPERIADMAGRTDRAIITETLEMNGVTPARNVLLAFADELAVRYEERKADIRRHGRTLAGVPAVLDRLAVLPGVTQSVLTGNMKAIAVLKLAAFDLGGWVDVDVGAYGMDDTDRSALVGLAQRRSAKKYREEFDRSTTVLVGDTPHDVQAGRTGGARVVAVATGRTGQEELRRAGADHVLPDLSNTERAVNAILDATQPGP